MSLDFTLFGQISFGSCPAGSWVNPGLATFRLGRIGCSDGVEHSLLAKDSQCKIFGELLPCGVVEPKLGEPQPNQSHS